MDGWNKPAIFAQTKDDYFKGETAVWPKWEIAGSQTCEDKRDCSEAEEGNAKLVNNSSWSPVEGILKQEAGGWPGSASKTIGQWNNGQNRKRCQNQYKGLTATSKDGPIMAATKRGNNAFVDGMERWEAAEGGSFRNHDDSDRWRQSRSSFQIVVKDSFSKSTHRDQSKYDNVKRQSDEWPKLLGDTPEGIVLDHIGQDCWRQSSSNVQMVNMGSFSNSKDDNVRNNNDLARCTEAPAEAGDAFDHQDRDTLRQPISNIQIASKESLSSSAIWDQAADNYVKKETDGWPKWSVAPSKGENSFDHDGHDRGKQLSSNIQIVNKGNLRNSADWNRATDDNVKRKNNEWLKWPKMPSKDEDSFVHDDRDRCMQLSSNIQNINKGGNRSNFVGWDRATDDNVKRENDGLPNWPKVPYKAGDSFDNDGSDRRRQLSYNIRNTNEGNLSNFVGSNRETDDNVKKNNDGWPKTTEQFLSSRNKKNDLQSYRLTKSLNDDDWQKENTSKNPDLGQNDDPWMPKCAVPKCNWNKSVSWTESTGETNQKNWGSGLAQTGSDPWKQVNPTVSPKAGWSKLVSDAPAVAQAESSDRKKSKWSGAPEFKKNRWNIAISSSSIKHSPRSKNRKDRWIQSLGRFVSEDDDSSRCFDASSANSSKYDQNTPTVWSKSGSDSFDTNPMKWDSNMAPMGCNLRKRLSSCEVSKFSRGSKSSQFCRSHFRGRSTTRFHAWEHGHIQSKDIIEKVSGRVSDQYRDSTSQRCRQVSKKTRCLESDKWINFNDPWKQRDHVQDIDNYGFQNSNVGFRRDSCGHDTSFNESKEMFHGRKDAAPCFKRRVDLCSGNDVTGKDFSELDDQFSGMSHSINRFMFQGVNHGDKLNHENIVNVLSSINQEVCKTFIRDSNGQPQIVKDDEGFRDGTIKSMITSSAHNVDQVVADSPHDLKSHQKKYVCSQLLPTTENFNSSDQRKQNHEQQANKEGTLSRCSLNKTSLEKQETDKQTDKKQESNSSNCEKDTRADGKGKSIIYEKGLFLFKTELAEFVKEKLTPHWKEGRLSKEAFKNVVKRVVDKVVCVQGSNFPQTKERIDEYMSTSESKLHKLVQDYLEMFINT